ncbi:MAG: aminoacetone oxidase family FAD-binding enzyme [Gemmatimonadales bacterium]
MVGAGAAGLMAAIFAARGGASVSLLERTRDGGRKILISGGGRCNILPSTLDERRFVTDSSPNTLRKILKSWSLDLQVRFFETELGQPLVEEPESRKLFPASNRARDVRDGLVRIAEGSGARFLPDCRVTGLDPIDGGWRVSVAGRDPLGADGVIVATGGLSVPNTGSDGAGLELLRRLGHTINPTYPALTPIVAEPIPFPGLAGVSLPVTSLAAASGRERASSSGGFLLTHRGYSGPAVLDVSHVVTRSPPEGEGRARLVVRWHDLDDDGWTAALEPRGRKTIGGVLRERLPDRLALAILERAGVDPAVSLAQLGRAERRAAIEALVRGELPWTGHEGYKKAEVTGGGVSLAEIDPVTMESRRLPGLFLAGEVLDAFGPIGGYNFLWAWVTGRAAGRAAAG